MMFSAGNHIADITAFDSVVAIFVHQIIGSLHVTLIVSHRSGCFVVHHQSDTLWMGILIEIFYIEVGIWRYKIKYIIFWLSKPIFPTDIPTFDQNLIKSMFGGKINISSDIVGVGRMLSVTFSFGVVEAIKFHRRKIICIRPLFTASDHFPPYAHILDRLDPWSVIISARFVKIEYQIWRKHITSIVTDHDSAPRSVIGSLHISFYALSVRCKPWLKYHILVIEVKMHARIVHQCGFVNVNIQSVIGFHLKRCLHTCRRKQCLRSVAWNSSLHQSTDLRQSGFCVIVFLRIIVTCNPPCRMVSGHCKLTVFFFHGEIIEVLLDRKLVTEAYAIIINAKPNIHETAVRRLGKFDQHFIVMISNILIFSPYRLPCLIKVTICHIPFLKLIHQIGRTDKLKAKVWWPDNSLTFIGHFISRSAVNDVKIDPDISIRGCHLNRIAPDDTPHAEERHK